MLAVVLRLCAGSFVPANLELRVDERRVSQILVNLLTNAVKFTRSGGRIRVAKNIAGDGGAGFAGVDTGVGMTVAAFRIARQPFGQVDDILTRPPDGAGIVLPSLS